jgi:hypothetical protein
MIQSSAALSLEHEYLPERSWQGFYTCWCFKSLSSYVFRAGHGAYSVWFRANILWLERDLAGDCHHLPHLAEHGATRGSSGEIFGRTQLHRGYNEPEQSCRW